MGASLPVLAQSRVYCFQPKRISKFASSFKGKKLRSPCCSNFLDFNPVSLLNFKTSRTTVHFLSTQNQIKEDDDCNVFSSGLRSFTSSSEELLLTYSDQPKLFKLLEDSLNEWAEWDRKTPETEFELLKVKQHTRNLMDTSWDWFKLLDYTIFKSIHQERMEVHHFKDYEEFLYNVPLSRFLKAIKKLYNLLKSSKQTDSAYRMRMLTFNYLLKAVTKESIELELDHSNRYFSSLMSQFLNVENNPKGALAVMESALRHQEMIDPHSFFEKRKFCPFLYSFTCRAWIALDRLDLAEKTYQKLRRSGRKPILLTYSIFLEAYNKKKDFSNFLTWWLRFQKSKFRPNRYILANLIIFLGSRSKIQACKDVFKKWFVAGQNKKPLIEPDAVIYTVMLKALISNDRKLALDFFETVLNTVHKETSQLEVFAPLIDSRFFATGLDLFITPKSKGIKPSNQEIESAMVLFRYLKESRLVNSEVLIRMIRVFGSQGKVSEAYSLLEYDYSGKTIEGCFLLYAEFLKYFGTSLKQKELDMFKKAGDCLLKALPPHSIAYSYHFLRQVTFLETRSMLIHRKRFSPDNNRVYLGQLFLSCFSQLFQHSQNDLENKSIISIKYFTLVKFTSRAYCRIGALRHGIELLENAFILSLGNLFFLKYLSHSLNSGFEAFGLEFKQDTVANQYVRLMDELEASRFPRVVSPVQSSRLATTLMKLYNETENYSSTVQIYTILSATTRPTPPVFRLALFALEKIQSSNDKPLELSPDDIGRLISEAQTTFLSVYPKSTSRYLTKSDSPLC